MGANLADPQNVGEKKDACGKRALTLSGIDHDKFTSCAMSSLSISASCAECYFATAQYGFANCKAACLLLSCPSAHPAPPLLLAQLLLHRPRPSSSPSTSPWPWQRVLHPHHQNRPLADPSCLS